MKTFLIKIINWLDNLKVDNWRDFSLTLILTLIIIVFIHSIKWIWILSIISWILYTIINALIIWKLDIDRNFNPTATFIGALIGGGLRSLMILV